MDCLRAPVRGSCAGSLVRQRLLRIHHRHHGAHCHHRHRPQRVDRAHRPGVVRPRRLLRHRCLHGRNPDDDGEVVDLDRAAGCCAARRIDGRTARPAGTARARPLPRDGDDCFRLHGRAWCGRMARAHRRTKRHHGRAAAATLRCQSGGARCGGGGDHHYRDLDLGLLASRCEQPGTRDARGERLGDRSRIHRPQPGDAQDCGLHHFSSVRRPRWRPVRAAVRLCHPIDVRVYAVDPVRAGGGDRWRRHGRRAAGGRTDRRVVARSSGRSGRISPAVFWRADAVGAVARAGGPGR